MQAPEVREELHPLLAREARTDEFLADRGAVLSQQGRGSFLSAVLGGFLEATKTSPAPRQRELGADAHATNLAPADHKTILNTDADGNEIGGVQLPDVAVPLATPGGISAIRPSVSRVNYCRSSARTSGCHSRGRRPSKFMIRASRLPTAAARVMRRW